MLNQIIIFILNTVLGLFSIALLLRFYMQLMRMPYRNPISQFLVALTDFIVHPARRVIPSLRGIDLSTLLLAWLTQFILLAGIYKLQGDNLSSTLSAVTVGLMLLAFVEIIKMTLHIVMIATIVQVALSWFSPHSPIAPLLDSFTRPFLRIFRERIPPIGNIDLSPLFVLVIIQLLLMATTGLQREIYLLF
ncbi:MAG: YggT family protein [Nitrosomonadales bacterium]|nr:MAG: YggT family protein [Nitrosomonadales bacterium]